MAEMIKVSTEEMQSTLNTFNTQKGVQSTAYESMRSTANNLASSWEGDACNAFQTQFNHFYKIIAQSEAKMDDAVQELAAAASLYIEAEDTKIKSEFLGIEVPPSPFA